MPLPLKDHSTIIGTEDGASAGFLIK